MNEGFNGRHSQQLSILPFSGPVVLVVDMSATSSMIKCDSSSAKSYSTAKQCHVTYGKVHRSGEWLKIKD